MKRSKVEIIPSASRPLLPRESFRGRHVFLTELIVNTDSCVSLSTPAVLWSEEMMMRSSTRRRRPDRHLVVNRGSPQRLGRYQIRKSPTHNPQLLSPMHPRCTLSDPGLPTCSPAGVLVLVLLFRLSGFPKGFSGSLLPTMRRIQKNRPGGTVIVFLIRTPATGAPIAARLRFALVCNCARPVTGGRDRAIALRALPSERWLEILCGI